MTGNIIEAKGLTKVFNGYLTAVDHIAPSCGYL